VAERDPYRVMGVPPISTESEIKKAYRAKSKEYHPDLNPDLRIWADEKMKELVEAYNILSDEEKKKAYDMTFHLQYRRERRKKKQAKKGAQQKGFMERLKDFFTGQGQPSKKPSKPARGATKGKKKEVEYNPKEAESHYGIGISMCDNNSFLSDTISSFKKATEYDPEHVEAHYNLGIAYYRKGEWGEATSCFQKVLKLDPGDEGAKYVLNILKEESF